MLQDTAAAEIIDIFSRTRASDAISDRGEAIGPGFTMVCSKVLVLFTALPPRTGYKAAVPKRKVRLCG